MVVNVIVPVYNVERYLSKCLDSLVNQTYQDILIYCVNDSSKDNSLSILHDYKKKYPNIIILNKENGGLSSARNFALDNINFKTESFITFVDSDDWISDDYISNMVERQKNIDADIVVASYTGVTEYPYKEYHSTKYNNENIDSYTAIVRLFNNEIKSHSPCKLYKSFLWKNIRFDENVSFMEDQRITFRLFEKANKISIIDDFGYYYLHRVGSLCQSNMTSKKILDALESYVFCYKYMFNYKEEQNNHIHQLALNNFADIFLMMYPRYVKNKSSLIENDRWKKLVLFEKKEKAVLTFKPITRKQKIKKSLFLICPIGYKFIFRIVANKKLNK